MTQLSSRHAALRQFATNALADPTTALTPASVDASFRSYWRSTGEHGNHIVMDAPPEHEDVAPWLDVAGRLEKAGVHVPEILASDVAHGFVPTWFLEQHLGHAPTVGETTVLERAFAWLAHVAAEQPKVFVHRDFHSRNLLVCENDSPGVIDFQDAVLGPLTYDLVSLLRDCYIEWDDGRVEAWVESYRLRALDAGLIEPGVDAKVFQRWFDLIGVQRHIKVLGIFCRLWYRDGKAQYLGDLPLVWRYIARIARRYPELADLLALLEKAVGDRDLTHAVSRALA